MKTAPRHPPRRGRRRIAQDRGGGQAKRSPGKAGLNSISPVGASELTSVVFNGADQAKKNVGIQPLRYFFGGLDLNLGFFTKLLSRAERTAGKEAGFTGCGKRPPEHQDASGHDFSRAVNAIDSTRASAPEGPWLSPKEPYRGGRESNRVPSASRR